jgi:hypothetical protein
MNPEENWRLICAPVVESIEQLLAEIRMSDFGVFSLESDLQARHWGLLRERLTSNWDVLTELDTEGARGPGKNYRPDLSVLRRERTPWEERRGQRAVLSAQYKYFSYTSGRTAVEVAQLDRVEGLVATLSQFKVLVQRVAEGDLGAGFVIWVDAYDWGGVPSGRTRRRTAPENTVALRSGWFRERFTRADSRVRAEYCPILYPNLAVSLPNGL